jgi:hypothetical protein
LDSEKGQKGEKSEREGERKRKRGRNRKIRLTGCVCMWIRKNEIT